MASKIQFKRGTTTQSNLYRGAEDDANGNTSGKAYMYSL